MGNEQGVTITLREIYDSVQEVASGVRRLDERITRLEERTGKAEEADERSRQALQTARNALDEARELKANQTWLWRTAAGALITAVVTGIVGLIFFLLKGGGIG